MLIKSVMVLADMKKKADKVSFVCRGDVDGKTDIITIWC